MPCRSMIRLFWHDRHAVVLSVLPLWDAHVIATDRMTTTRESSWSGVKTYADEMVSNTGDMEEAK